MIVVRIPPPALLNLSGAHSEFKKKDSLLASMSDKNRRKFERICKEIGEENTQILMEYITFKRSENISERRLERILDFLYHLGKKMDKRFLEMTQQDLEVLAAWINSNEKWSEWTRWSYLNMLKNFARWLNDRKGLELQPEKIKSKTPKNKLLPEDLITEDEINKLINGAPDLQFKTLLSVLYESACRISEILNLKIKHVKFNQYGAVIRVSGKTGARMIPLVWSSGLLRQYIESHPKRDDPEAYLWFIIKRDGSIEEPIKYESFRKSLKRLCKKVGLNKRIYPHLFRHSRLSVLCKKLPEPVLKQVAGWVADTKMTKTYLHLSLKDVEDVLLAKVYGIEVNEEEQKEVKICPKCKEKNPAFAKYCVRCASPLNENQIMEHLISEEELKQINEWAIVFKEFLKVMERRYPEMWEDMSRVIKKLGKEGLIL